MSHRRQHGALWHAWWPSRERPPSPGRSKSEDEVADNSVAWLDLGIGASATAMAFVARHRKTLGLIPAYVLVALASAASALLLAGLAFSVGLVLHSHS